MLGFALAMIILLVIVICHTCTGKAEIERNKEYEQTIDSLYEELGKKEEPEVDEEEYKALLLEQAYFDSLIQADSASK